MSEQSLVKKRRRSVYRIRGKFFDFSCALPAIIFFVIFTYYPIVELFRYSMTDWNLMKSEYHYVTIADVAASCIFGMLLALLFDRMSRAFKFMRTAVILPKYVTMTASVMVFELLYNTEYGLINRALSAFKITPIPWLTSPDTALLSVILFSVWRSVGYAMMIYLSAMKGLSPEYFEAASLDGANGIQKFRYITLPLIAPTTVFLGVTSFLAAMKVYQTVELLTGGGPYESTSVIVYWIYALAFRNYRVDRASAVGVIFFLILLICTILTMNVTDRRVNYDA